MANEKNAAAQAADDEKPVKNAAETAETDEAEAGDEVEGEEEGEPAEDADEEGEKPDGEVEAEADEEGKPSKSKLKRERVKARIATLEEIAKAASQRAEAAEAQLRSLSGDVGKEPKFEDYGEDRRDDYIADRAAWKADQTAVARQRKAAEAAKVETTRTAGDSKFNLFRERTMALSDRFADIEAKVLDPSLPMDQATAEILMDSERGPEVAYHLATHREELQRIQGMPPLARARELGRIEALIAAPKPRTVTKAPKPVPVIGGGSSKAAKDPEKMTTEEWMEHERKRMARTAQQRRA